MQGIGNSPLCDAIRHRNKEKTTMKMYKETTVKLLTISVKDTKSNKFNKVFGEDFARKNHIGEKFLPAGLRDLDWDIVLGDHNDDSQTIVIFVEGAIGDRRERLLEIMNEIELELNN